MRNFRKILLFLGLACLLLTVPVLAAELPPDVEDALPREAGKLLDGVGQWDAASLTDGLRSIWVHMRKDAGGILSRQTRGAASILLVVLLCSLVGGFQKTAGASPRFLTMAGTLAIAALPAGSLDSLMGSGAAAMEQMNTFSKALLPMLAAVSALSGGVAGATLRQIATVFFADLLLEVIHGLLMPMVYLYAGTLAAGGSLSDRRLLSVAEMIRSICVWLLTTALLLFTLYLTVSGIFAGTVDSVRVRVEKTAISGVVPVVGGIIAEASETVLAGASVLKGTIGVFGLLGVLALCAYPFLQLGIQYLLYQLIRFLASVIGSPELCAVIKGLGGAFGLILGMVGSCALVLLISILASAAADMADGGGGGDAAAVRGRDAGAAGKPAGDCILYRRTDSAGRFDAAAGKNRPGKNRPEYLPLSGGCGAAADRAGSFPKRRTGIAHRIRNGDIYIGQGEKHEPDAPRSGDCGAG